jgi:hypothetical protein
VVPSQLFYDEWRGRYQAHVGADLEKIRHAYDDVHRQRQDAMGHFFRNMYNLLSFIDNSDLALPYFYANLVRAQLSTFELLLLFYHCLSDKAGEGFKLLVEKYGMLKDVARDRLVNAKSDPISLDTGLSKMIGVQGGRDESEATRDRQANVLW